MIACISVMEIGEDRSEITIFINKKFNIGISMIGSAALIGAALLFNPGDLLAFL